MKPNNPFLIAGYYSPEYFCDRKQETGTIIKALDNGRNLTLIAPRRMGKTGLIKNSYHLLKKQEPEIVTLYMDIYSTQNLTDFVQLFANTVLGALDSTPQKAMKRIGQFIKSIRPVFTLDQITGVPKVTVDITPSNSETTLKELFEYLQSSDKRCYIAIDEFQQLTGYPEKGVEALLRSYIQFTPNVNFIFAGSKQHVMRDMFLSAKRPFYQSTQLLAIDSIAKDEYYSFAAGFFGKQERKMGEDVFSYIYARFEGHTWYLQAILNRLYSYKHAPTIELVDYAVREIVAESAVAYESLLAAYSAGNIKLLKAIAKEGCVKEINAGEFILKYKLKAASSVNTSLKKLIDREMVYKSQNGYIVYDRLMTIWLQEQPY